MPIVLADIEQDAEVQAVLRMAEAAMEAEEEKRHWCWKMLTVSMVHHHVTVQSHAAGKSVQRHVSQPTRSFLHTAIQCNVSEAICSAVPIVMRFFCCLCIHEVVQASKHPHCLLP